MSSKGQSPLFSCAVQCVGYEWLSSPGSRPKNAAWISIVGRHPIDTLGTTTVGGKRKKTLGRHRYRVVAVVHWHIDSETNAAGLGLNAAPLASCFGNTASLDQVRSEGESETNN